MKLDLNFDALTKLKDWWKTVKGNFEIIERDCTETREIAENACTPEQAEGYLAELAGSNAGYMEAITAFKNLYEESGGSTAALEELFGERVSLEEYNSHKNSADIHHTHENKEILDGITSEQKGKWDEKSDVVFGVYTGDGESERMIDLGFEPAAVVVYRKDGWQSAGSNGGGTSYAGGLALRNYASVQSSGTGYEIVSVCENGFTVYNRSIGGTSADIGSNTSGKTYYFVAYKNGGITVIE